MKYLAIIAVVLCSGCAGFSGKREIKFSVSIMNNTIQWSSTCDGSYPEKPEVKP